jgi:hypothetical protein
MNAEDVDAELKKLTAEYIADLARALDVDEDDPAVEQIVKATLDGFAIGMEDAAMEHTAERGTLPEHWNPKGTE